MLGRADLWVKGRAYRKDTEQLAHYRGGFAALADQLKEYIELKGGQVITDAPIKELIANVGQVVGVRSGDITFHADAVIATPALAIIANLVEPHVSADYTQRLRRIRMSDEDLLEYTIPYLQEMFPAFHRNWILKYHIWKAHYSQPIVERRYSRLIPKKETPFQGLYIATMAQIYPEDRGTNYAVREGRLIGKRLIANISKKTISESLCERHDV